MTRIGNIVLALLLFASPVYAGKISARSSASTPLTGSETIGIIQNGLDVKSTVAGIGGAAHFDVTAYGADKTGVADSHAAIVAAQTAAAATCGTVFYPGGTYLNLSAVTLAACVKHEGIGWALSQDGNFNLVSGSILKGDTTAAMFVWNPTDLGGEGTNLSKILSGSTILNLAFDSFTYPIKVGARYDDGMMSSEWRNLFATKSGTWGFYCENCSTSNFENLHVEHMAAASTGAIAIWTSETSYIHGNNNFRNLLVQTGRDLVRCISFMARDGAKMNDNNIDGIQCNTSNNVVSQSATFSNDASGDITVTDGTKFPVDLPVTFSATGGGVTQYQVYYVVSQVSNVIRVANRKRGTVIAVTTASPTIKTYGFEGLEIVANADVGTAVIEGMSVTGVDLEGNLTCNVTVQSAYLHLDLAFMSGGQGTVNAATACIRNSYGNLASNWPISYDSDFNSGVFSKGIVLRTGDAKPVIQYPLWGGHVDKGGRPYSTLSSMLQSSAVAIPAPADTNQNVLKSVALYPGSLGKNGCLRWTAEWTGTNNANAKTVETYLNGVAGTQYYSRNFASTTGFTITGMICNRNSVSSQVGSVTVGTTDAGVVLAWGKTTSSVDTSALTSLDFVATKASGGDTITLERYHVELFPGQ